MEEKRLRSLQEAYQKLRDFNISFIDAMILISAGCRELSIAELQREILIAHKNILPHLKKLQKYNLITIKDNGKGKRKLISTNLNNPRVSLFMAGLVYFLELSNLPITENNKVKEILDKTTL